MEIGAKIRAARMAAGLTQSELARAINQSRTTINNWETGKNAPRRSAALLNILGLDDNFEPVNTEPATVSLDELDNAQLVAHLHLVAAEVARRLGQPTVELTAGAEATLREQAGAVQIDIPGTRTQSNRRAGGRRHT